ncbi:Cu2+-exporting ATPase [Atopostipes suicloacalis DSM 15692]|uniref:P-type Cu(+) transporter n=1 Tax=Atopostipes suicloacalis DSM 15692 TaxID=1121025 RepID=A0A1M4YCF0_9LACT|nr:heavy metal translocating P-type ATPase [Atopostipes suicloacalis]SHF03415.1 Cu2+-exporting ATPase [Atopostipes suicloacalis DSM 15692]
MNKEESSQHKHKHKHADHKAHESHNLLEHEHHEHHDHEGHDHHDHGGGHEHHHHGNFKELFLKSLPLGIIIMVLSPMMGVTLPFQFTFPYSDILVAIVSTILLVYGGKPFYQGAMDEFKQKAPGMMALVSLGVSVSYLYSIYAVVARYMTNEHIMDFFFEFASLILIMLLGHWIEMKAVGDAGDAQKALAELVPKDAQVVLEDDSIETRPVADLKVGDIIRVQAGENIPADGKITKGESRVDEALLTGESKPVEKNVEDQVIGGSTNREGVLFIEVEETGDQSFISQVQTLISEAQNQPSKAENTAHKVAGWLFYIALAVAIVAFVTWLLTEDLQTAVTFTVTTLVIACPHALGLAIPLVVARSTSLGASRGLLVKDREALEQAKKSDVMILDKTGTLTTGEFKVLNVNTLSDNYSEEEISALMAGIEAGSSHPIAQSIIAHSENEGVRPVHFDSIDVVSGAGVEGKANNKHYKLISQKAYEKEIDVEVPKGATLSILVEEDKAIGTVALGDELKPASKHLIDTLKNHGIEPIMATGDNEKAAQGVAEELGIEYKANQSPQDKYNLVEQLTNEGKTVIMVGDGVNDAPSLALADVGIAVGAGTQVALDSADIILTQSDPADIEAFLELSDKTTNKMTQNLWWGAGYNFIAIPLAAGVLAPIGFSLSPAVGAILMSISTVIVAINAMMLKLDKE